MSLDVRPGAPPPDGEGSSAPPRPTAAGGHKPVLATGRSGIPHRALVVLAVAAAIFALTAALSARFLTSTGSAPPTTPAAPHHTPGVGAGHAAPAGSHALRGSLADFLGLESLHGQAAPSFSLTDPVTGAKVSLASLHGRVVVLTFADAACDDLCPVLLSELRQTRADLASTPVPVTFLTVNTDPLLSQHTTVAAPAAILSEPSVTGLTGWRFLNGSVSQLDPVWTDYGISITVNHADGAIAHNNRLYFIGPDGKIKWMAIPFADESRAKTFSLPAAQIDHYARGIAHYARLLATKPQP